MDPDLETLYSPSQWCHRRCSSEEVVTKHLEFIARESNVVRNEVSFESNVRYGYRPRQLLDIYEPDNNMSSPTIVFIHGGYWQMLEKESSCYCVQPLIKAGLRVVVPDYDLAPDVSLQVIIEEIKELTIFLHQLKVDRQWGTLWLCGHSAGAHLAASVLCSESFQHVAGFILISGIYDLRPLINTSVNAALQLTSADAVCTSPALQVGKQKFPGPILLAVGEFDSPAFQEQQQQFAEVLKANSNQVTDFVVNDVDHFTIVENLSSDSFSLTKTIIQTVS